MKYSVRNIKNIMGIIAVIIAAVLFMHPETVLADRFQEDDSTNYDGYDISNHLEDGYWVLDGSFMRYTDDDYYYSVGVDVSKWNGSIDWYALKEQGVEFAIIRVGFRGNETGEIVLDDSFYEYMNGASSAGLKIGVYFYSQAIDEEEAVEEAMFVIEHVSGYYLDLPIYFDTEETEVTRAGYIDYTSNAVAFCQTIEAYGYRAGVYASNRWIRWNLDLTRIYEYEIWYARYNDTPGREYGFDMWQYTETGDLYGCDTYLDMNIRVYKW